MTSIDFGRAGRLGLTVALLLSAAGLDVRSADSGLTPRRLTVESAEAPETVDVQRPRFGWQLVAADSAARGLRQTAYQIRVANAPDELADGRQLLWDSGPVRSTSTVYVEYRGRAPLESDTDYWWTVRVWDGHDRVSAWAEPVRFQTGLVAPSDWRATWIENPDPVVAAHHGYRTTPAATPAAEQWVVLDMYRPVPLDQVRLYPTAPYDLDPRAEGFLFPLALRVETANREDFTDATEVAAWQRDSGAPGPSAPVDIALAPSTARYLRLVVTRLAQDGRGGHGFALAELEARGGGKPYSRTARVTASDPGPGGPWDLGNLIDTVTISRPSGSGAPEPSPHFRRALKLRGPVSRARAFVAALGLYELHVNGERVGPDGLSTDWTDYRRRVQYRAFDVTARLRSGDNVIGLVLGDGWYAGRLAFLPGRRHYGDRPRVIVQVQITYQDGTRESIVSDDSWRTFRDGLVRGSDLFDGETQDGRRALSGWSDVAFDDGAWSPAREVPAVEPALVAQVSEPIAVTSEVRPVSVTERSPGIFVIDFGQNLVGRVRARMKGARGTRIELRHAEMLEADGSLYIENLRLPVLGARATDTFILAGSGDWEEFEPKFTYHGFRYVEVSGLPYRPDTDTFVARVMHSAVRRAGVIETSDSMLNRLVDAIWWTQRGNFVGIPTDCPQRGERGGWMGDAQVFAQTSIYNADVLRFFDKWLTDVRDAQDEQGRFAAVSPSPGGGTIFPNTPGWADAATIVPWRLWVNYGDRRVLERHIDAAMRFVDAVARANPDGIWRADAGVFFGDWLNADLFELEGWPRSGAMPSPPVFATAYFAFSADLVAKMAAALGRDGDAARYRRLAGTVREAFVREFVKPDGRVVGGAQGTTPQFAFGAGRDPAPESQAAYAMALHMRMVPDALRTATLGHLDRQLARYGGRLSTGIQATLPLMLTLAETGRTDEAYRLLRLREPGTWAYMLDQGATTIWERWDGFVAGRGFHSHEMNSFNHYAMGAVGEWIWRHVAGLSPEEDHPGYERFVVAPRPGGGLSHVSATYESVRGPIKVEWRVHDRRFSLAVEVPPNTSATLVVPGNAATVREGGRPLSEVPGVEVVGARAGGHAVRVGSGRYSFTTDELEVP